MPREYTGLITLCKNVPAFQTTLFTSVSFNQKALCTAVIDIQHVITAVKKKNPCKLGPRSNSNTGSSNA